MRCGVVVKLAGQPQPGSDLAQLLAEPQPRRVARIRGQKQD
jgi:hypothetical protein